MKILAALFAGLVLLVLPQATPTATSPGHVVYALMANRHVYELLAQKGSAPVDVTYQLNHQLSPPSAGADAWINISPDGKSLLLSTERFGCAGWACLAVVSGTLKSGAAIKVSGNVIHADQYGAIASGGALVVYPDSKSDTAGPHQLDLWAVRKSLSGVWGKPLLLTAKSPAQYNEQPAISGDGKTVLFDCGSVPYSEAPTQICKVSTSGGTVTVAVHGGKTNALHHPDFGANGSIVFEGDWQGEQIWKQAVGSTTPVKVSTVHDDNSPCVLPTGRIVSLWLDRTGNTTGAHEIKVMNPDGTGAQMLLENKDVLDVGIGCGL